MPAHLVRARDLHPGAGAGANLDDVLKTTVYVASADRRDLLEVWQVVHAAFGSHDAPSTLLGIRVEKRNTPCLAGLSAQPNCIPVPPTPTQR